MLVNCVAYQEGKKLADISVEEIRDYVSRPAGFVWVALKEPQVAELAKMQEEFQLHELAVEDAHHGHQRPKMEEYGDSLFAVLHIVELQDDQLKVGELNLFVADNYLLSVRSRAEQSFAAVRARCESEPQLLSLGSGFVFYALMDAVVDRYFPVLDELEQELEQIEEQIFNDSAGRLNIKRLYALKRKVMVLKHAVAPLIEAVSKLSGGRVPSVCHGAQEYFRDIYDHLYRINLSIDTMRDTIATAIQANISLVAIEEGEVTKRLAAWAAIFAVATALVGIWGMNFVHMPELEWRYGYPAAMGLVAVLCGFLYYRLRRARWL